MAYTNVNAVNAQKKRSWRENYFLKAFALGLGLSFLVFLPFILVDGGRFLFYGDFNVQQVPFYRLAHDAVRAGNLGWNHQTDLGANFIGSYSFYLLGSPFFWLTIPFPSAWLQFLMGPLLILKFACATLTGYVYIHRYTKSPDTALIGAVLYAFSGFSVYNIFFNHFHEAIIFFPLMLAALDEYMENRRRGLFALTVFACCLVNYYFFVGQVTFTLIYFFLRLICGSWKISWKDFLLLALEAVIGVGLSCVLLVPSVLAVMQNNRVGNPVNGWNAVLYNRNQRYLHIIECFFFPPDLPARPNFTPESESKWSSLGAWLPLFGMTGVVGWLQLRRKHWLKKMLWILFAMALVPFLNAAFQMMNASYYARWYYMLTLMMALATVMALENERVDWRRATLWCFSITLAIAGVVGFMPVKETVDGEEVWQMGLEEYPTRFWTYTAISLLCLGLVVYLFTFCRKSRQAFKRAAMRCLSAVAVLYAIFFIALGKTQSDYTWDHIIPYELNGGANIPLTDLQNCRSDFFESMDNAAMFWQVPSIQAFHSIVPGSVMEFYSSIGVQRDVGSRPKVSHYPIRGLLSVQWLFDDDHDGEFFAGEALDQPAMPGWAYYGNSNGYDIWENEYYIPMGFSYDFYQSRTEYEGRTEGSDTTAGQRELSMLRAVVLEDNDLAKVQGALEPLPEGAAWSEAVYLDDCQDRAAAACTGFTYTGTGFTASFSANRDRLVFFSVPYEPGWEAEVNGQKADILRANVGFMAVLVPEGDNNSIVFTYTTPGLGMGTVISLLSLMGLIGYLTMARRLKLSESPPPRPPRLMRAGRFSAYMKKHGAGYRAGTALRVRFQGAAAMPPPEARPLGRRQAASPPPRPAPADPPAPPAGTPLPPVEPPGDGALQPVEPDAPAQDPPPEEPAQPKAWVRDWGGMQPRPWPQRSTGPDEADETQPKEDKE
ncbi:YfhO family protein [Acutalibacter caecimuris]|uniref:YfhO family protein n=1 Tax=Acutalibacter caecimuris TaxID=3093657 RepID=UPI002AC99215|nr:YfhO family protein [Acutalibacter sp. M00118]